MAGITDEMKAAATMFRMAANKAGYVKADLTWMGKYDGRDSDYMNITSQTEEQVSHEEPFEYDTYYTFEAGEETVKWRAL